MFLKDAQVIDAVGTDAATGVVGVARLVRFYSINRKCGQSVGAAILRPSWARVLPQKAAASGLLPSNAGFSSINVSFPS